ncbi:ISLre2 family transposase, partial [Streptococcus anginosus]
KKEFIGLDNRLVREQVIDYLFNNYEITNQTLLITNSDGGHGYTPYVFKEIAKVLRIKRHEHFWDEYHVNKELKNYLKFYSEDLLERAFQAIKQHDKQLMRTVLDTTESYIDTEEEQELFEKFKSKILRNFQYTKPAEQRGFSHAGIGIMESQHRKVTYRMKKRGMYWTLAGAETMSRIIVLNYEDSLRELFFGNWREDYEKFISLEEVSAYTIKKRMSKTDKENTSRYQCYPDSKRLSYFRKQ